MAFHWLKFPRNSKRNWYCKNNGGINKGSYEINLIKALEQKLTQLGFGEGQRKCTDAPKFGGNGIVPNKKTTKWLMLLASWSCTRYFVASTCVRFVSIILPAAITPNIFQRFFFKEKE